MVFNTVLCLVRAKKHQISQGYIPSRFPKKEIITYTASQYGLGTWEGSLNLEGGPALASRKGGIQSLFLTWALFTSGQYALFFNN